jgi:mannosyl-oligosaccharide alpha-1,2-mannosidase
MERDNVEWNDEEESFWSAETLKYLYLIFDDVSVASLDDWIFSTEGHLFRKGR